jgi:hypothetical protein
MLNLFESLLRQNFRCGRMYSCSRPGSIAMSECEYNFVYS